MPEHKPTTKGQDTADPSMEDPREMKRREEEDRQTHLINPLTHPSSGDPPPAVTKDGERLGAVPMTLNANREMEKARLDALIPDGKVTIEKPADKDDEKSSKAHTKRASGAKTSKPKSQKPADEQDEQPVPGRSQQDVTHEAPKADEHTPMAVSSAASMPSWLGGPKAD